LRSSLRKRPASSSRAADSRAPGFLQLARLGASEEDLHELVTAGRTVTLAVRLVVIVATRCTVPSKGIAPGASSTNTLWQHRA
jgi:hypothetical protein